MGIHFDKGKEGIEGAVWLAWSVTAFQSSEKHQLPLKHAGETDTELHVIPTLQHFHSDLHGGLWMAKAVRGRLDHSSERPGAQSAT